MGMPGRSRRLRPAAARAGYSRAAVSAAAALCLLERLLLELL
jgi:hypothetical protein